MIPRLYHAIASRIERLDLGGWALAIAAILVIAPTVLVPAHLEVRELARQQDQLNHTLSSLQTQRDNYHTLLNSLDHNDPILLTRLAWHELHLKPIGTQPLDISLPHPPSDLHRLDQWTTPHPTQSSLAHAPILDTRFIQLSTGPHRPYLLGLGALLAGASLLTSLRKTASP